MSKWHIHNQNDKRILLVLGIIILCFMPGLLGSVTRNALVDAYIGVSVFVALTLLLFYGAEKIFKFDLASIFRRAKYSQVPLAAILGALPGCGGAIIVVSAYTSGNLSMGAVVATLTATMGDAAFLLIAKRPEVAVILFPLTMGIGIITGYIIDLFYKETKPIAHNNIETPRITITHLRSFLYSIYIILFIPGLFFGIADLLQVEFSAEINTLIMIIGVSGIAVSLIIWSASPVKNITNHKDQPISRMAEETSFITIWVVIAYLIYEYLITFAGIKLDVLFNTFGPLLPLVAIIIGFIPGCGPQILVTTFYINGLIPFAALLGNSIANDGDALFPAIALNPSVAVLATLYSAIPAIIVAYAFYIIAPGFLTP